MSFAIEKIQGPYFVVTGLWPILLPSPFQVITGWKADMWLAQAFGGLLALIGLVLFLAGRAQRVTREITWLGAGSAAYLIAADFFAVSNLHSTPAYLGDVVVETVFLISWFFKRPVSRTV